MKRPWLFPVLAAAVTFTTFVPSLRGEFLNWDDDLNFTSNEAYRGLGFANLKWMWTAFHSGHYHPITWMTLGADYTVWGMNPFGYHLTNIVFHAANAALLYLAILIFLRILGRPDAHGPALLGALVHALHPLRVESVAWITERRDVVCGCFTLLALLAYLRMVEEERAGRRTRKWLVLAVAAFGASLLSKALSVALPAVLVLLDLLIFDRLKPGARGRVLLEKVPFFLLSALDAWLMSGAARAIDAFYDVARFHPMQRVAQAAYGLCFYLVKTVLPVGLAPLYKLDLHLDPAAPVFVASMAAVFLLTILLLVRRRRWPGGLAAWAAYGVLLSPVLGAVVTGLQIAADRYSYLAMMPASLLGAWLLSGIADGAPRRTATIAASAALAALALLSARQCTFWADSLTLWERELAIDPHSAIGYQNRGVARQAAGDLDGAVADYDRAIELDPRWAKPFHNRGVIKAMRGNRADAIRDFTRTLQINPLHEDARYNRALARFRSGDYAGAAEDYDRALQLSPGKVHLLAGRGQAALAMGRVDQGIADYTEVLKISPEAVYYLRRAGGRGMKGDLDGAIADCTEALKLKPDLVEATVTRGQARLQKGDRAGAAEDFSAALAALPSPSPQRTKLEELLRQAREPK